LGLSVVIALAAVQGRDLPKLSAGLVSDETVAARVPFRLRNEERTLSRADLRRASAERVYATNEGVLREIEGTVIPLTNRAGEIVGDFSVFWEPKVG